MGRYPPYGRERRTTPYNDCITDMVMAIEENYTGSTANLKATEA